MPVSGSEVDPALIVKQGGRIDYLIGQVFPQERPVRGDGIELSVGRADVDVAVAIDDRRAENAFAGIKNPERRAVVNGHDRAFAVLKRVSLEFRPRAVWIQRHIIIKGNRNVVVIVVVIVGRVIVIIVAVVIIRFGIVVIVAIFAVASAKKQDCQKSDH